MVPVLSMVFMALVTVGCIVVPFGAMLWIWSRRHPDGSRRYPRVWRAFWCGMLAFVASQVLTRIPLMTVVVPQLPEPVSGFLLSGPVASYTAGLFEETGRLVVMLLLLKAFHRWIDGVSFGLGHGGIEAMLIVGMANVNNLVLAATINAGQWDTIAQALPPEAAELLHGTFNLVAVLMVGAGIDLVLVEVVLVALAIGLWVGIMKSRPLFPTEIAAPPAPGSEVPPAPRVG